MARVWRSCRVARPSRRVDIVKRPGSLAGGRRGVLGTVIWQVLSLHGVNVEVSKGASVVVVVVPFK